MAWEFGKYWIKPGETKPLYLFFPNSDWVGPQFLQAKPAAWGEAQVNNPVFIMDQAVVNRGYRVLPGGIFHWDYEYGCDIYNPSSKWLEFSMVGY
jgi:hypothetical protein